MVEVPAQGLGGKAPYDFLLASTDPKLVKMEMDLCWATVGNQDPLKYFAAYPGRFPLSATLAGFANGSEEIVVRGDARRTVDEIRSDVLEAVADEVRHLLEEGVVAEAADVDTCLILGAGFPFLLGGITKLGSCGDGAGTGSINVTCF